ncbi:MAG: hypothetical protein U1E36_01300 [Rickettsiales bacterium]
MVDATQNMIAVLACAQPTSICGRLKQNAAGDLIIVEYKDANDARKALLCFAIPASSCARGKIAGSAEKNQQSNARVILPGPISSKLAGDEGLACGIVEAETDELPVLAMERRAASRRSSTFKTSQP